MKYISGASEDILLVLKIFTHDEISVIDFTGQGRTCSPIPTDSLSFLYGQSAHGTFVGGKLLVCSSEVQECYKYDDASGKWSNGPQRNVDRFMMYGLDMDENTHLVSGGGETAGLYGEVYETEIFDGEEFTVGLSLPLSIRGNCMGNLGNGQAIVATGTIFGKMPENNCPSLFTLYARRY